VILLAISMHSFMTSCDSTRQWWDRDVDAKGRQIRSDLRTAAHEIWDWACNTTQSRLGDNTAAAELMELAIAQASAYLDKNGIPLNSHSSTHLASLMRRCFGRVLHRQAQKLKRLELIGSNLELSDLAADRTWSRQIDARVDSERIIRLLSEKCRTILTLRDAGYEWQEIATVLKTTVSAVKKSFFREIRELQRRFCIPAKPSKTA
jgi:DNA-directed RNA polymerase specialized sigma24 family protein